MGPIGFFLRFLGVAVVALVLLCTVHQFGWLPAGQLLTIVSNAYADFVSNILFAPARGTVEAVGWQGFVLDPPEELIITLTAVLIFGPGTYKVLLIDHEFRDAGPAGPFIIRFIFFFIALSAFAIIAGLLPVLATLMIFGLIAVAVMLFIVIHAHLWPTFLRQPRRRSSRTRAAKDDSDEDDLVEDLDRDDEPDGRAASDEDEEPEEDTEPEEAARTPRPYDPEQHNARYMAKYFAFYFAMALLLVALDRNIKLEDDCLKVAGQCRLDIKTPKWAKAPEPPPQDAPEWREEPPEDPPQ